jgi:hypothetical protein
MVKSGPETIVVVKVEVLFSGFGSAVALEIVAVSAKVVPSAVPAGTCAVSVMVAVAPATRLAVVQVTVPLVPTAGLVQAQPVGTDALTKVSVPGSGSVTITDMASSGPTLVAMSV